MADWPEHERYDLGPPSIAWLTWHMIFWWSKLLDHSFGEAQLQRESVPWPGDADGVRTRLLDLRGDWRARLVALSDADLHALTREALIAEAAKLRAGIRQHRDSTEHELCWHHPQLWRLLPEGTDRVPVVPAWPEFCAAVCSTANRWTSSCRRRHGHGNHIRIDGRPWPHARSAAASFSFFFIPRMFMAPSATCRQTSA